VWGLDWCGVWGFLLGDFDGLLGGVGYGRAGGWVILF